MWYFSSTSGNLKSKKLNSKLSVKVQKKQPRSFLDEFIMCAVESHTWTSLGASLWTTVDFYMWSQVSTEDIMLHYTAMGFKASGRLSDLKHCSDSRQVQVGDCQTLRATVTVGRWTGGRCCQTLRATVTVGRWTGGRCCQTLRATVTEGRWTGGRCCQTLRATVTEGRWTGGRCCQTLRATVTVGRWTGGRLSDLKGCSDRRQVQVGDCQTLRVTVTVSRWETVRP